MVGTSARLVGMMLMLLLTIAGSVEAQQPSGRADLEVSAKQSISQLMAVRVVFAESNKVCPEDSGILQITDGKLRYYRAIWPKAKLPFRTGTGFKAVDDDTYEERIATDDCRVELAVRQQVRQPDGSWRPLLVSRIHRPGLSPEERRAALHQAMEDARERAIPANNAARQEERRQAYVEAGSLKQGGVTTMRMNVAFDNAPSNCFEALGNVAVDQVGVTFLFLPGLPGGVNHFVVERSDRDSDRARFYFSRGACRFEIIVSASVRDNRRWIARGLQPFDPSKARLIIERGSTPIREPSDARPSWLDRVD